MGSYTVKRKKSEYSLTDILLGEINNRLAELTASVKGVASIDYCKDRYIKTEVGEDSVTLFIPSWGKDTVTE